MSASLSSTSDRSPLAAHRSPPLCPHFGVCGGCRSQDISYGLQLERKCQGLEKILSPFWEQPIPIQPSPDLYYYRNKMEFSFGRQGLRDPGTGEFRLGGTLLGLKPQGRWDRTLDIQECLLLSPETPALLRAVREWAARAGIEGYDQRSSRGSLRHLVVREGKNTSERMVALHSAGEILLEGLERAVLSAYPASTILWGSNAKRSDVAAPDHLEVLCGPGFIEERLGDLRFRISHSSFFQTNTRGAENLYARLADWIGHSAPRSVLDLYGGCGGIGFSAASRATEVTCVDVSPSAVEDARANADLNGISNIRFVCARVEDFIGSVEMETSGCLAILDPPRAGLHPRVLQRLVLDGPPEVIYVSCNPTALARDLKELRECYRIGRVEALDLFPHTEHVEVLVKLEK